MLSMAINFEAAEFASMKPLTMEDIGKQLLEPAMINLQLKSNENQPLLLQQLPDINRRNMTAPTSSCIDIAPSSLRNFDADDVKEGFLQSFLVESATIIATSRRSTISAIF